MALAEDPGSVHSMFVKVKVLLMRKDAAAAGQELRRLLACEECSLDLLRVCASGPALLWLAKGVMHAHILPPALSGLLETHYTAGRDTFQQASVHGRPDTLLVDSHVRAGGSTSGAGVHRCAAHACQRCRSSSCMHAPRWCARRPLGPA